MLFLPAFFPPHVDLIHLADFDLTAVSASIEIVLKTLFKHFSTNDEL